VTLRVELVVPDGEVWSGRARMVIAKTLEGDLGILSGHQPVLAIIAEGSLIRIIDLESAPEQDAAREVTAAVSSGFLAVRDNRVSILARQAQLGSSVDASAVRADLNAALETGQTPGEPESAEVRYSRALLRAAGERS
jgi:F-type H+-transporting ATPase subunit epsilon